VASENSSSSSVEISSTAIPLSAAARMRSVMYSIAPTSRPARRLRRDEHGRPPRELASEDERVAGCHPTAIPSVQSTEAVVIPN